MKRLALTGKTWTPDADYTQKYLKIVEANRPAPQAPTMAAQAATVPTPVKPSVKSGLSASEILIPDTLRAVGNYLGKMASGVGSGLANFAGSAARIASEDKSYLERPSYQLAKARGDTAYASKVEAAHAQINAGLKSAGDKLVGVSDKLAESSKAFQAKAEKDALPIPGLRWVANTATDLIPFFALNAIPGAGQAVAGAYLVGDTTGEARRAGLSETSQAALGLASVLSMGAAGQVGKALGGESVMKWALAHGKGGAFARTLEAAAARGLATGLTRQGVSMGTRAALGVYAEQVRTAEENLKELAKTDLNSLTPEQRTAHESAVSANRAIVNSGGVDFTAAVAAIAFEVVLDMATAGIAYKVNEAEFQSRTAKPLTPEETEYFKGVTTPEEAKKRFRELSRAYHPDLNHDPDATEIMARINGEYERLGGWIKAQEGGRAQTVSDAWAKAKSGQGVTRAEADAANNAVAGLLRSVRESGDAETVAALEQILAPLAAEINAAPVPASPAPVPTPTPSAPATPQAVADAAPVPVLNAPEQSAPVPVPNAPEQSAPVSVPDAPRQAAPAVPDFAPPQTRKPFVTFDEWRKLHPEIVAEADALARRQVSEMTAEAPAQRPDAAPVAPTRETRPAAPQASAPVQAAPEAQPVAPEAGATALTPLQELMDGLDKYDRVEVGGLRFEIRRGTDYALAQIRRVDTQETEYVQNAANDLWRDFLPTPEAARDALISVARNSFPQFRTPAPVDNPAPSGYADGNAPQALTPEQKLLEALKTSDAVTTGGYRFVVSESKKTAKFRASVFTPDGELLYEGFFPAREQAAERLSEKLKEINAWRRSEKDVAEASVTKPKEVATGERRGENRRGEPPVGVEARNEGGILQPASMGTVVSQLGGAVEAEDVQAPEGTGGAPDAVQRVGRRDNGDSDGELQRAGNVGRTGNREGTVSERPGGVTESPEAPEAEARPEAETESGVRAGAEEESAPEAAPVAAAPEKSKRKRPAKKAEAPPKAEAEARPDAKPENRVPARTEKNAAPEKAETARPETPKERTEAEIQRKTEQSANPKGKDFAFPEGGLQLPNGEKSRAKANIAAVEILRKLESEGRPATAEEQDALSKFVGWGGLSNIFDEGKPEWDALRGQLKDMLSDEEYAAAKKSTLNAHYTSQEVIEGLYAALEGMGFKGGRILEPSAGIGHFNGAMPANLRGKSRWTMVELDPITGGIAKALYPNADVRVQGFENALLPENYYDAAISNVPFGNIHIHDKSYPSAVTQSIHNYFFAKALDKVRPGGVVAFVTSRYTLDSTNFAVRRYLSTKADLLGAVRLPDTAFKANAGTDVVTDILILKKRPPNTPYGGEAFAELVYQRLPDGKGGFVYGSTNEYFEAHPEMILGTIAPGKMYGGDGLTWKPKDTGKSLKEQIREAFASVTGRMEYPAQRTLEENRAEIRKAAAKGKVGGLVRKDGKIYRNVGGALEEATDVPKSAAARMGDILTLRDAARALLDFQQNGATEKQIQYSRKGANALYDDFVKNYGPLHSPQNQRLIKLDTEGPFILSLEKYDKDTKTATKADLFSKNTIAPNVRATHADTVEDALAVSLNETGTADAARIAALVGETPEAVTQSLLERGLAFLNRDGNLETAEQYLSGNIRAKLKDAEALAAGNPEYNRNVEALEKVIPPDIEPENIIVQIGATWVPDEIYSRFASEMAFGQSNYSGGVDVTYNRQLGEYRAEPGNSRVRQRLQNSALNTTKWGTPDRTFLEIFSATLNNKSLQVWRKKGDGSRILDQDATNAVKEKAKAIQAEFQDWLFRNADRRETLTRLYNDLFNNSVVPRYDGSKLTIDGLNTGFELRPHQKDDIQRIIMSGGNTLIARKVGAGKTLIMAGAAMKLRQLGVCRKPMIIAPKGLVGQWGREFLEYFPGAKVLVPGDDFSAAKRKEYVARIATGDYDAVILSYEQFKFIPMSAETQAAFLKEKIGELEAAIEAEKAEGRNGRSYTVKQTEKRKANLETKLKSLMEKGKDENNISFESTGVDALFVDEAHNFKNLAYTTHLSNVAGMGDKNGRDRPFDLSMKIRYLQRLNDGRGVVLATATPVMNSVPELYIMQLYLQPDELSARGIYNFDAWQKQFAVVNEEPRISVDGKSVKFKQTLSRFNNVQTLQQSIGKFMTPTEAPGLKVPKMRGGKRIVVKCEPSEVQRSYMNSLGERLEAVHARRVKPEIDNMLKIEADGRKICYSQRVIDPSLPYEPNGKIMKCSRNVFEEWKNSEGIRGTQIIFCDFSTPKSGGASQKSKRKPADVIDVEWKAVEDSGETEELPEEAALAVQEDAQAIQIYHDMKNILVGMGITGKEIAFIHDAKTQEQRNQLFDDMNKGKVRVLIGSTGKMGVGMNAQKRVVALHHMDAPHRPGDIEQREGRALRQGNINDEVAIYNYVTDGTLDALLYDRVLMKQTFIDQLTSSDFTGNSFEFGDNELSYGEIKAAASGNPLVREQSEIVKEIARLEGLERAHRRETFAAQDTLKSTLAAIAADKETAAKLRADIATRQDTSGKAFSVTLDGKAVTERKAAGEQIVKLAQKILKPGQSPEATKKVGTFAGFDLLTTSGGDLLLRGQGQYRTKVNFESPTGTVQSLEAAARKLDSALSATESRLKANQDAAPELEKAASAPFAQASELTEKRKRAAEILVELSDDRKGRPSGEDAPDAETSAFYEIADDGESGVFRFRETSAAKAGSRPERWTAERVGDASKKPLTPGEVIAKYRRGWGFDQQDFHVTSGHVRGARGQYQRQESGIGSGGIRLKVANDLPVFTHELGHALDDKYHITETLRNENRPKDEKVRLTKEEQEKTRRRIKVSQELKGNLDPAFAAQYKDNQLISEGFAEFVRRFCQNRLEASAKYPETVRFLMSTLSGEDQARLLSMADEVNAVYSLDENAQSSIRRMDEKSPDYRGFSEKLNTNVDRVLQATVDSLHSVKKLSQRMGSDVWKRFYNANYADSTAHFILTEHLCDLDGQYIGPGLRTVLQGVNCNDRAEYDAFGEYLVIRNAPSWIEDDKRVLPNDRKNNVLYCEIRQEELERRYPNFKAASEALYDFWDRLMRTYVVGTGLISQEQYDAMRAKHPYYVPFKRVMDDVLDARKGFGTHRAFANQPNPVKRAKGSGRDIFHPVDSIINTTAQLVYQGVHQRDMLDLIDVADAYGLDAAFMERVPAPVVKQSADISGIKAQIAERVGNSDLPEKSVEELLKVLDEQADVLEWYSQRKYLDKDCIGVRRNGELEVYKVNDPLLFDALANMGRPQLHELLQPLNKVTRFVSSMITGWNITWSLFSNAPRDLVTALVYSTPAHRLKLLPKIAESYVAAIAKARNSPNVNPYYMEYLALGGGQSSAWGMDTKLPKKVLSEIQGPANATQRVLNILKTPLKWIEFVSRATEAGPRAATYEMFREDGADPQTAFRAAMEITVDFRQGGKISRALNAVMPFFNAGVQGMAKDVGALSGADAPKKDRAKVVRGRLTLFLTASLIGAALEYALNNRTEKDRKSYNRLSTYTKNSYFCIPTGDGKFFGVPKPRGIAVPLNFFRAAMERTVGGNRHAYDGFWQYAATAELPNGVSDVITLNPSSLFGTVTIIGPMAQLWANADFRGMPIESAKDRKLSPRERYSGSTSALAKGVGGALNLSPKQIDFMGNNTLGAAWQYQKALFPVDASKRDLTLGVQSKYVKDSLYSQDAVNRLYNLADKSSKASMDDLTDTDSKVTAYFDSAMTDFYGRYNSLARSEDDAERSDRATRELVLTLIEDYLSAREEGYLTAEQEAVYAVCRAEGDTDKMLPSARQNTVKDGDGAVRNLTAAQYYDYQGNFNALYWNFVKEALPQAKTDAEKASVLRYAVDAAGDMAKNNALMKLGAKTTADYKKYEELQLYSVPISAYLVAKARTQDIVSLTDKRTGKTLTNSQGALIAEAVRDMELGLPTTNQRKLMETLGVGQTVLEWSDTRLTRKLKEFRKDAGAE